MGYGPWGLGFWEILILVFVFASIFKPNNKHVDEKFANFSEKNKKDKKDLDQTLDAYEEDLDVAERKIEDLEERVRVLERIVTDEHKSSSLKEEIDQLKEANNE